VKRSTVLRFLEAVDDDLPSNLGVLVRDGGPCALCHPTQCPQPRVVRPDLVGELVAHVGIGAHRDAQVDDATGTAVSAVVTVTVTVPYSCTAVVYQLDFMVGRCDQVRLRSAKLHENCCQLYVFLMHQACRLRCLQFTGLNSMLAACSRSARAGANLRNLATVPKSIRTS
jgi:hypothetical protein